MTSPNTKNWTLSVDDLTDADVVWLKGLGVKLDITTLTDKTYLKGELAHEHITGYQLGITTNTDKQVNMLLIKYADDLILKI